VHTYTTDGITVIEGLGAIRARPTMYIGPEAPGLSLPARLLECIIGGIAAEAPPGNEVRLTLYRDGAMSIAFDGEPLSVEPRELGGVSHPALYLQFLHMFGASARGNVFCVANALSDRLVVSTMHGDDRYRVAFSRGAILALLRREPCETPQGTTWLTYAADSSIITGPPLTMDDIHVVAERVQANASDIGFTARELDDDADWS
jgi:DNA gyrase/topoisomerase IV subunit B